MIKLINIYEGLSNDNLLSFKVAPNAEFMEHTFYANDTVIGTTNIRLKKGWNQLHISINPKFQGKGYAERMIGAMIIKYKYVSIPEGRIINDNVHKVINKLKSKYNVHKTEYDEWVIYNDSISKQQLDKIFN